VRSSVSRRHAQTALWASTRARPGLAGPTAASAGMAATEAVAPAPGAGRTPISTATLPAQGSLRGAKVWAARLRLGAATATLGFLKPSKDYAPSLIAAFAMPEEAEPGVLRAPLSVDAVQLVALNAGGSGKASVAIQKRTIGSPKGVPIVVAPPNDLLGISIHEGVEDALSAHQATGLGAWASGGALFLPNLADAVPSYVETITVVAHRDEAGRRGALKLARRLAARGFNVLLHGGA
jgi:Toprim domain